MTRLAILGTASFALVACGIGFQSGSEGGGAAPAAGGGGTGGQSSAAMGGAGTGTATGGSGGVDGTGGAGGETGGVGGGTGGGPLLDCVDTYATGFADLQDWYQESSNNGNVALANGGVEVTAGDQFSFVATNEAYDLDACGAQVRIAPVTGPEGAYFWFNAVRSDDFSDRIELYVSWDAIGMQYIIDDAYQLKFETTFDAQAHQWMRMRHVPPNLIFGTSPDGQSWSLLHEEPEPDFVGATFGFGLGSANAGSSQTVRFDDFAVRNPP